MKILAIDSSANVASAAIMTEGVLVAEYTVNHKKTHSQTLLPMIDEIVKMSETELSEIDAIAIAAGPGSFTGLRIGAATVKGLALALNKPVIGVPTVDALAYGVISRDAVIVPLMDARRAEVYTGIYENKGNFAAPAGDEAAMASSMTESGFHVLRQQCAVPLEDIIREVNTLGRPVIYLGDGVDAYTDRICELTKVPYMFAPAHSSKQRASVVGALAFVYYKNGKYTNADDFSPIYLRLSQAERELLENRK